MPATGWWSTARCWRRPGWRSTSRCSPASPRRWPARPGDRLLSGSFVAAGSGRYRTARRPGGLRGPAHRGPPLHPGQLRAAGRGRPDPQVRDLGAGADRGAAVRQPAPPGARGAGRISRPVAGTVAMVPEGLVLLTSVAAVGVVRLGRRQVLVRELGRRRSRPWPGWTSSASTRRARSPCGDLAVQGGHRGRAAGGEGGQGRAQPGRRRPQPQRPCGPSPGRSRPRTAGARRRRSRSPSARKWSGASFAGRGAFLLGAPRCSWGPATATPSCPAGPSGSPSRGGGCCCWPQPTGRSTASQ